MIDNVHPITNTRPPLRVAVIIASTRQGRFGTTVAAWFLERAERRTDIDVEVIDLLDLELPASLSGQHGPAIAAYRGSIERADAYVVVTPEYNHGYPGPLKQAIDLAHAEWERKAVGFVAYGGLSGGLRAVEQLRQVFAELHVASIRDAVSFHGAWARFDDHGEPLDREATDAAADVLLDQLTWWARALRTARQADQAAAAQEDEPFDTFEADFDEAG